MKIKRTRVTQNLDLYRLTGEGVTLEKRLAGDGMAVSWAAAQLTYRDTDNREGVEVPQGEYLLVLVGPNQDEPKFKMRKHDPAEGVICSWEGA